MKSPALSLALTLSAALAACTAPTARQKVEIQVLDDGQCAAQHQSLPCGEIGRWAAARYTPGGVSAVLLISPHAPHDSVLATRSSLQAAHIGHVQYGDPASFRFDRSEPGADG